MISKMLKVNEETVVECKGTHILTWPIIPDVSLSLLDPRVL